MLFLFFFALIFYTPQFMDYWISHINKKKCKIFFLIKNVQKLNFFFPNVYFFLRISFSLCVSFVYACAVFRMLYMKLYFTYAFFFYNLFHGRSKYRVFFCIKKFILYSTVSHWFEGRLPMLEFLRVTLRGYHSNLTSIIVRAVPLDDPMADF